MPRLKKTLNDTNQSSAARPVSRDEVERPADARTGSGRRTLLGWLIAQRDLVRLIAAGMTLIAAVLTLAAAMINHPEFVRTFVSLLRLVT